MDKEKMKKKCSGEVYECSKAEKTSSQYWSKHRITLIAFEAKFINERKQHKKCTKQNVQESEVFKKKISRSKIDPQYENGFLNIVSQKSIDFQVKDLIQKFQNLKMLFQKPKNKDFLALRQFIKHLLEVKHSIIVQQFCHIYNIIIPYLREVETALIVNEKLRTEWLQAIRDIILNYINEEKNHFPMFSKFLQEDYFNTRKLLLVEIYCLTAEKFNFHTNEFYSETFQATVTEDKLQKRVKKG